MKFYVYMEFGSNENELREFQTLEEAIKEYEEQRAYINKNSKIIIGQEYKTY